MKIQELLEGISVDVDTDKLKFNFEEDIDLDIVKFFNNTPIVHDLGGGLFTGFVFSETTTAISDDKETREVKKLELQQARAEEKKADLEANVAYYEINQAFRVFHAQYERLVKKHSNLITDTKEKMFFRELTQQPSYQILKKYGGDAVDQAIKDSGRSSNSAIRKIEALVAHLRVYEDVTRVIPTLADALKHGDAGSSDRITKLKSQYKTIRTKITRALNAGIKAGSDVEYFMYFAADRLAKFNGFGFEPDLIIRPKTNSKLLLSFVDMVSAELGVPAIEGLIKPKTGITYAGKQLMNRNGTAKLRLDDERKIGRDMTMAGAARRIEAGTFKIASIDQRNRHKVEGLYIPSEALIEELQMNADPKILLLDDSIFTGTTQREMMTVLSSMNITNVASYAIIKTN